MKLALRTSVATRAVLQTGGLGVLFLLMSEVTKVLGMRLSADLTLAGGAGTGQDGVRSWPVTCGGACVCLAQNWSLMLALTQGTNTLRGTF